MTLNRDTPQNPSYIACSLPDDRKGIVAEEVRLEPRRVERVSLWELIPLLDNSIEKITSLVELTLS